MYWKAREEIREVYDRAHRDQETGETVATRESVLLDVDQGEVLGQGIRYQRRFDVFR